jgi:Peptidase_C39 like family
MERATSRRRSRTVQATGPTGRQSKTSEQGACSVSSARRGDGHGLQDATEGVSARPLARRSDKAAGTACTLPRAPPSVSLRMGYHGQPDGTVRAFYASNEDSGNGCGQAAVATLVRFTGKGAYAHVSDNELVRTIYHDRQNKPDTPNQWFGSTPGHVENVCGAAGLEHWRTYGPGNARSALEETLQRDQLMIVLLDLGKLGGKWHTYHYSVAYGYDENGPHLTNMVGGESAQDLPWDQFLEAWHCWSLPSPDWQYAGIVGY